jgi:DNA-binding CsgD family transcriptional regulator
VGNGQGEIEFRLVTDEHDCADNSPDVERRVARLTEGQRLCLLLVAEHRSSKEIARHLGISPHTVDQRIRIALGLLGVRQRADAARLLVHSIEATRRTWSALPWVTRHRPRNDMSLSVRLSWIAAIAAASSLVVGLFLAGLESLSELLGKLGLF